LERNESATLVTASAAPTLAIIVSSLPSPISAEYE
jgi:hypothetical protein